MVPQCAQKGYEVIQQQCRELEEACPIWREHQALAAPQHDTALIQRMEASEKGKAVCYTFGPQLKTAHGSVKLVSRATQLVLSLSATNGSSSFL